MTEYEIWELYNNSMEGLWSLLQFWSSVSFGYLALGVIAVSRLNILSVLVLSVLYIAFSIQIFEAVGVVHGETGAHVESMKLLSETIGLQTPSAIQMITADISGSYMGPIAIFGTFIVAILSLPYQYWRSQREDA
jgi:hypothetical protein